MTRIKEHDENPRLKPICELKGKNFFIPRYQRGYRWGKQEITELLDDILTYSDDVNFPKKNKITGDFYCLQPIVVNKKKWTNSNNEEVDGWEVIDGQQRLTSIYIILTYLEEIRQHHDNSKDIYNIDFETRDNCAYFFKNKEFIAKNSRNVDYHHISMAYKYVADWFEDKPTKRLEIVRTILNKQKNISVIWYEAKLKDEQDSIDLFTRLNEGKIPLTDAELIKASLLQADHYPEGKLDFYKQRLFEIASEWDNIEAYLNNDKVWFFLNEADYDPSSKISFIFKILTEKWFNEHKESWYKGIDKEVEEDKKQQRYFQYIVFDKYLNLKQKLSENNENEDKDYLAPVNQIWKEIKDIFGTISEWYEDHTLFHYIGYLVAVNPKGKEKLFKNLIALKKPKDKFTNHLKELVAKEINFKIKKKDSEEFKKLNELAYNDDDNNYLIRILLLFNIETLVNYKKENARFPFHLFKIEKITSLEHIHPQNPESFNTDVDRSIIWLKKHKTSLDLIKPKSENEKIKIKELCISMDTLIMNFETEKFKDVYKNVIDLYTKHSEIKENEMHTLYNMALVDKDTNSSLNNSFFDIKREILKKNKLKRYIPICTQRAFSKYYSEAPQEMIFWSSSDRQAYFNEIETIYESFLKHLNSDE